jgi:selenocysteine-specific elongation factor
LTESSTLKNQRHFVIGTAGHIDHGKTSLVKNLTGTDTDRLKEEIARGMTIDLGFAFLNENITIIDVPGHEKFIRNMVAGVSTIDLVLFVVAADDGIMPQTREHLDILNFLHVQQGIIVITKVDMVENDWLELVKDDIKTLVQGTVLTQAPILCVSNQTGLGIAQLREEIQNSYEAAAERIDRGVFRMPIDRVFSMKGFGTVVAGTVISGSLSVEQNVELLPTTTMQRVRGLQIHEQSVNRVRIGDRAAINLAGIEKTAVTRGDVLAEPGFFSAIQFWDARFYGLKSGNRLIKNASRVRIHIGTSEVIGRITILDKDEILPGQDALIQVKLERAVVADVDDRFVVRSYSPLDTIGGGRILDVHPRRHKRFDNDVLNQLQSLERGDSRTFVEKILLAKKLVPLSLKEISQGVGMPEQNVAKMVEQLEQAHRIVSFHEKSQLLYVHRSNWTQLSNLIIDAVQEFHHSSPMKQGITKTELRAMLPKTVTSAFFNHAINELSGQQQIKLMENRISLPEFAPQIPEALRGMIVQTEKQYIDDGFSPSTNQQLADKMRQPEPQITMVVDILLDRGTLIRIDEKIFMHIESIRHAKQLLAAFCQEHQQMTVSEAGQILNTSRKFSVPLLNYLDHIGFTFRQGDVRIINPDALE